MAEAHAQLAPRPISAYCHNASGASILL